MNEPQGLRERKKAQTKQALVDSAYKLFAKQGYEKTSIEDITKDANFAPRTFFLHFTSKEDLLFPDAELLTSSLDKAFYNRGNQSALEVLSQWIRQFTAQKQSDKDVYSKLRRQLIGTDRMLHTRQKLHLGTLESTLSREFARDLELSEEDLRSSIAASAAIAIFGMLDEKLNEGLHHKTSENILESAFAFLEAGMSQLKRHS